MKRAIADTLRRLADRLHSENTPSVDHRDDNSPQIDAGHLGLVDACMSGWFNQDSSELFSGFRITDSNVVLDMGCGDGGMSSFCARMGARVVFSDINEEKIRKTAEILAGIAGARFESVTATTQGIELADSCVDRVICTEVLEHVDDPRATLQELVRVGKPGALYLLSVPSFISESAQVGVADPVYFKHPNHIRIFAPGELRSLAATSGLEVISESRYGFFWFIWWMFFWGNLPNAAKVQDSWAATWSSLISTTGGAAIAAALNNHLGKSDVFIARKS